MATVTNILVPGYTVTETTTVTVAETTMVRYGYDYRNDNGYGYGYRNDNGTVSSTPANAMLLAL